MVAMEELVAGSMAVAEAAVVVLYVLGTHLVALPVVVAAVTRLGILSAGRTLLMRVELESLE